MKVIAHLENFCGGIVEGWGTDPEGKKMPFQVIRMEQQQAGRLVTFSTLGLSRFPLTSLNRSQIIRQELIMIARGNAIPANLLSILTQAGEEALTSGFAYLRGNTIGPRGRLFIGSELEALYVSNPVYFPDDFSGVDVDDGRVIFAWLIPITGDEAEYVAVNGWSKFEDVLVVEAPDLLNFSRKSIFS